MSGEGVERSDDHHNQREPLDGRTDPVVEPVDRGGDSPERRHPLANLCSPEINTQLLRDSLADLA